jgi:hypothetical protein
MVVVVVVVRGFVVIVIEVSVGERFSFVAELLVPSVG